MRERTATCLQMASLIAENAVLARELAAVQKRSTQFLMQKSRQLEQAQATLMRLRAELIKRDTTIAALRDQLRTLAGGR